MAGGIREFYLQNGHILFLESFSLAFEYILITILNSPRNSIGIPSMLLNSPRNSIGIPSMLFLQHY